MTGGVHEALDRSCVVEYGTRVVQKRDGGSVYPVYGGGGATFKMDTFNREDRLVVSRFGMSKECTRFVAGKFFLNDSGLTVRPRDNRLAQRFLDYQILSLNDRIFELGKGSAQKNLDVPAFRQIDIIIPDNIADQQRIVAILDEAFDGIATARANAEQNLQNARAIFKGHLQAVFSQRGEGWVETTVGDQLMLQRGFDITKDEQREGNVPVVSSGGIKSFHDTAMAKAPGVVIGRKGTLGKVFYLDCDFWPHDTTLWVKDFKGNERRFIYYLFAGLDVKKLDSGAANPALNRNQVHPIKIWWPAVERQQEITLRLDSLAEETQRLESIYQRKIDALDELKKSLLNQAFSGNL